MVSMEKKVHVENVCSLNYNCNIVDIKGDIYSYENLTESIKNYGVQIPVFIDKDKNVIDGNRRVLISIELELEEIPVIFIDPDLSEFDIELLKIDFLTTSRHLTHLDSCKIYHYQNILFKINGKTFSTYMSNLLKCDKRNVQMKIQAGEVLETLSDSFKNKLQEFDRVKKVPFKSLQLLYKLSKTDLNNYVNDVVDIEGIDHEELKSITNDYEDMIKRKKRNEKIKKDMENSLKNTTQEDSSEDNDEETPVDEIISLDIDSNDIELNEVGVENENVEEDTTSEEYSNNKESYISDTQKEPDMVDKMKKVLKYEIKKHFNLDIDTNEEVEVMVIKSELDIDFNEEIELIQSLLKEINNG